MKYTITENRSGQRYFINAPAGSKLAALDKWLKGVECPYGYYTVEETDSTHGFSPQSNFHVIEQPRYRIVPSKDVGE